MHPDLNNTGKVWKKRSATTEQYLKPQEADKGVATGCVAIAIERVVYCFLMENKIRLVSSGSLSLLAECRVRKIIPPQRASSAGVQEAVQLV